MTVVVDFVPFATGGGANVEDQADYIADTQTSLGWTNGTTADSAKCNKAWRQACFMAAVLATFISTATGASVLDDGDLPGKVTLLQASVRQRIAGNTTWYVSPSGNDSTGNGSAGSPWLTIGHAYSVIAAQYDGNGFTGTISCANGTYTSGINAAFGLVGFVALLIEGSGGSTNCTLSVTNGSCFIINQATTIQLQGMLLEATGTGGGQGFAIATAHGGYVQIMSDINFGACATGHLNSEAGGTIQVSGNYKITGGVSGGTGSHLNAVDSGSYIFFDTGVTATLTGTPVFATAFANTNRLGEIFCPHTYVTWSGAASGPRYFVDANAVINTNGGGATYLPGSTSGSLGSNGAPVYI